MPVANQHRCFWRIPKKVTTFLTNWMVVEDGAVRVSGGHDPAWSMDDEQHRQAAMDAIGMYLRDVPEHTASMTPPWTWYARWYRHAAAGNRSHGGDVLRFYAGKDPNDEKLLPSFREVLYGVTHLNERQPSMVRPLGICHTAADYPGPGVPGGLYTWLIDYMLRSRDGAWLVDVIWDATRAYEVVETVYGRPCDRQKHYPRNTAQQRTQRNLGPGITDYRDWYDDEMLGWVADADSDLISLFGFKPFCSPDWLTFPLPGRENRARLVTPDCGFPGRGTSGRDSTLSHKAA